MDAALWALAGVLTLGGAFLFFAWCVHIWGNHGTVHGAIWAIAKELFSKKEP